MATTTVALRIGPADHGRAMTLDEFLDAEEEPGYRYELALEESARFLKSRTTRTGKSSSTFIKRLPVTMSPTRRDPPLRRRRGVSLVAPRHDLGSQPGRRRRPRGCAEGRLAAAAPPCWPSRWSRRAANPATIRPMRATSLTVSSNTGSSTRRNGRWPCSSATATSGASSTGPGAGSRSRVSSFPGLPPAPMISGWTWRKA